VTANSIAVTLPAPSVPFVDPASGMVSRAWWYWFQRIMTRTGGQSGSNYGPPARVPVTGSPFVYSPPSNGMLLLTGGGVSRLRYSQDGSGWFDAGNFYAPLPITVGGSAEVTYVRAPVVTFIPGS